MIESGEAQAGRSGALRIRTVYRDGSIRYEPLNLEHKTRLSDNPWIAKSPSNIVVTDAAQNQEYLETLRAEGAVWPTDATEDFIVRHQLNDEGLNFAPGALR
jgi:hypothetical protein